MEVIHNVVLDALERDGIAMLPGLLKPDRLARLRTAFGQALERPSFNTWRGYEQTEKWRLVIEDVLTLDPAAFAAALDPQVLSTLRAYVGPDVALVEARGWRTIACRKDFHGWHGDAWFHPSLARTRPREVKLGLYLTGVESGHFSYLAGTHKALDAPRHWSAASIASLEARQIDVKGPAGTAFLFDTWGVHRQSVPVMSPRDVIFFNYHDPVVPLQELDIAWGRYRPLMLNAGMLPADLSPEQMRVLGFGRARDAGPGMAVPGRAASRRFPAFHDFVAQALRVKLEMVELQRQARRVSNRLRALRGTAS